MGQPGRRKGGEGESKERRRGGRRERGDNTLRNILCYYLLYCLSLSLSLSFSFSSFLFMYFSLVPHFLHSQVGKYTALKFEVVSSKKEANVRA